MPLNRRPISVCPLICRLCGLRWPTSWLLDHCRLQDSSEILRELGKQCGMLESERPGNLMFIKLIIWNVEKGWKEKEIVSFITILNTISEFLDEKVNKCKTNKSLSFSLFFRSGGLSSRAISQNGDVRLSFRFKKISIKILRCFHPPTPK